MMIISRLLIILILYLVIINAAAVIITCADKHYAAENKWRIPEKVLMATAFLGGAAAMLITMKIIRHKTRHKKFMIGLPLIIALQIAVVICALYTTLIS